MPYILYFNGETISITLPVAGVNKTYITKSHVSVPYNGIIDGEFAHFTEISGLLEELVTEIRPPRGSSIAIAVPSCFCKFQTHRAEKAFDKPTRITQKVIDALLDGGKSVYYKIDGGNAIISALDETADKIEVYVSKLVIAPVFLDAIRLASVIRRAFKKIEYIPVIHAEANYLIEPYVRDKTCVLISCKMTDTSVATVTGDQIVAVQTFDMGAAHIINDISVVQKVDYTEAKEMLARYTRFDNDRIAKVVTARISDMAEQAASIIGKMDYNLVNRPICICGGYTDAIYGADEIFEKALGKPVIQLYHPINETNIQDEISRDAVISEVL